MSDNPPGTGSGLSQQQRLLLSTLQAQLQQQQQQQQQSGQQQRDQQRPPQRAQHFVLSVPVVSAASAVVESIPGVRAGASAGNVSLQRQQSSPHVIPRQPQQLVRTSPQMSSVTTAQLMASLQHNMSLSQGRSVPAGTMKTVALTPTRNIAITPSRSISVGPAKTVAVSSSSISGSSTGLTLSQVSSGGAPNVYMIAGSQHSATEQLLLQHLASQSTAVTTHQQPIGTIHHMGTSLVGQTLGTKSGVRVLSSGPLNPQQIGSHSPTSTKAGRKSPIARSHVQSAQKSSPSRTNPLHSSPIVARKVASMHKQVTAGISHLTQDQITEMRNSILRQRRKLLQELKTAYVERLTELFFLQHEGNMMDYHAWKKRVPNIQLDAYLAKHKLEEKSKSQEKKMNDEVKLSMARSSNNPVTTPVAVSTKLPPAVSALAAQIKKKNDSATGADVHRPLLSESFFGVDSSRKRSHTQAGLDEFDFVDEDLEKSSPKIQAQVSSDSSSIPVIKLETQSPRAPSGIRIPTTPMSGIRRDPKSPPSRASYSLHQLKTPCSGQISMSTPTPTITGAPKRPSITAPSPLSTPKLPKGPTPPNRSADRLPTRQQSLSAVYDYSIGSQEMIVERAKQEAQVMQRISELRKEGLWSARRLPRVQEPPRHKTHWDYLLEEMQWLSTDFGQERRWKKAAARKLARAVAAYHRDKHVKEFKAERDEANKLKKIAANIAKEIKHFWANIEKVVQYKQQSRLEEKRKKALDMQLDFIVGQTEKYSTWLSEGLTTSEKGSIQGSYPTTPTSELDGNASDREFKPIEPDSDDEETIDVEEKEAEHDNEDSQAKEIELLQQESEVPIEDIISQLPADVLEKPADINEVEEKQKKEEPKEELQEKSDLIDVLGDGNTGGEEKKSEDKADNEFVLSDEESEKEFVDEEDTIDEQEEAEGTIDYKSELTDLQAEGELSMEELLKRYAGAYDEDFEMPDSRDASDEEEESVTSEEESEDEVEDEADSDDEELKNVGMEYLLQPEKVDDSVSRSKGSEEGPNTEITDIAEQAQSLQPTGYTLSETKVNTKVPFLLRHTLREYQHIGLDWLVTMYEKKLNGILADEMGLGKTIQTIALFAHLACEKENWGPHLIVVPTSVMLNWEMELKKWCPAFKILTYFGNQKERKEKRRGWTKQNAFHVCITSYKLVIQDHVSFRRKKWKYLVLDEAQNIKNFKSQRWQTLLNFNSQRRLLLTGTPLQNNLMELWSLMHFLMPHVFQSHREFREWFSNPLTGMIEGTQEYNEGLVKRLHKVLRPFLLRRLKSQVEKQLPQKYEHVVKCRLSKRQRFLYDDFMSKTKTKETLQTGQFLSVINILMQLRKVCNHPDLFEMRPTTSPFIMERLCFYTSSLVIGALQYNPFKHVSLEALNFCLADLELTLPAYIAHRTRQLQTPRKLIEEIDSVPLPPPRPPKMKMKPGKLFTPPGVAHVQREKLPLGRSSQSIPSQQTSSKGSPARVTSPSPMNRVRTASPHLQGRSSPGVTQVILRSPAGTPVPRQAAVLPHGFFSGSPSSIFPPGVSISLVPSPRSPGTFTLVQHPSGVPSATQLQQLPGYMGTSMGPMAQQRVLLQQQQLAAQGIHVRPQIITSQPITLQLHQNPTQLSQVRGQVTANSARFGVSQLGHLPQGSVMQILQTPSGVPLLTSQQIPIQTVSPLPQVQPRHPTAQSSVQILRQIQESSRQLQVQQAAQAQVLQRPPPQVTPIVRPTPPVGIVQPRTQTITTSLPQTANLRHQSLFSVHPGLSTQLTTVSVPTSSVLPGQTTSTPPTHLIIPQLKTSPKPVSTLSQVITPQLNSVNILQGSSAIPKPAPPLANQIPLQIVAEHLIQKKVPLGTSPTSISTSTPPSVQVSNNSVHQAANVNSIMVTSVGPTTSTGKPSALDSVKIKPDVGASGDSKPKKPSTPASVLFQKEAEEAAKKKEEERKNSPLYLESLDKRYHNEHKRTLTRIFRTNYRRCCAKPIYGEDLYSVVSILRTSRPSRKGNTFISGAGMIHHHSCMIGTGSVKLNAAYEHTNCLRKAYYTTGERMEALKEILKRYVIVVPTAVAPPIIMHTSHPPPSYVSKEVKFRNYMEDTFWHKMQDLHPIANRMKIHFPELRLIQYDCGKLQAMDALLRQLKEGSHRVLIFTQMAKMLDVLERFLNYHGHIYLRLDGATKIENRQILMERFNADKRIFCFILSTRSGGVGVNLTGADTVIFYDSDWNPTMDAQAQDRCHRIGQTRDVHIYRLVSEMTVEENILKKANQKRLLVDVSIEGGNFTTAFFKKSTITDLFNVSEEAERMEEEAAGRKTPSGRATPPNLSQTQLEQALAKAEDETDVRAATMAHAEQDAELAEFDESIPYEGEEGKPKEETSKVEMELAQLDDQLTPIEKYAVKYVETTLEPITSEQLKEAEEQIEEAKKEWELGCLQALHQEQERRAELEEDEIFFTYGREDATNKIYISQKDEIMPIWAPPTPPQSDNDVYIDQAVCLMYEQSTMTESQLPPVFIKREPKRIKVEHDYYLPTNVSANHFSIRKIKAHAKPEVPSNQKPTMMTTPPQSLFNRPSASLLRMRRDVKRNLIGKPVVKPLPVIQKPASTEVLVQDKPEWLINEDWALLQAVQTLQELPLTLQPLIPGHTINWDLISDIVNSCSRIYRSPKQCKLRYENVIIPREEGKIMYDTNPKKQKKNKGLYNRTKGNRAMKTGQVHAQDANSSHTTLFSSKIEGMKMATAKRTPFLKQVLNNPLLKNPKHSAVLNEFGISYDKPMSPIQVAAKRAERIAKEKKLQQEQQQQRIQAAAAAAAKQQQQQKAAQAPKTVAVQPVGTAAAATVVQSAGITRTALGVTAIRVSGTNSIVVNTPASSSAGATFATINRRMSQQLTPVVTQAVVSIQGQPVTAGTLAQVVRSQTGRTTTLPIVSGIITSQVRSTTATTTGQVVVSSIYTSSVQTKGVASTALTATTAQLKNLTPQQVQLAIIKQQHLRNINKQLKLQQVQQAQAQAQAQAVQAQAQAQAQAAQQVQLQALTKVVASTTASTSTITPQQTIAFNQVMQQHRLVQQKHQQGLLRRPEVQALLKQQQQQLQAQKAKGISVTGVTGVATQALSQAQAQAKQQAVSVSTQGGTTLKTLTIPHGATSGTGSSGSPKVNLLQFVQMPKAQQTKIAQLLAQQKLQPVTVTQVPQTVTTGQQIRVSTTQASQVRLSLQGSTLGAAQQQLSQVRVQQMTQPNQQTQGATLQVQRVVTGVRPTVQTVRQQLQQQVKRSQNATLSIQQGKPVTIIPHAGSVLTAPPKVTAGGTQQFSQSQFVTSKQVLTQLVAASQASGSGSAAPQLARIISQPSAVSTLQQAQQQQQQQQQSQHQTTLTQAIIIQQEDVPVTVQAASSAITQAVSSAASQVPNQQPKQTSISAQLQAVSTQVAAAPHSQETAATSQEQEEQKESAAGARTSPYAMRTRKPSQSGGGQ